MKYFVTYNKRKAWLSSDSWIRSNGAQKRVFKYVRQSFCSGSSCKQCRTSEWSNSNKNIMPWNPRMTFTRIFIQLRGRVVDGNQSVALWYHQRLCYIQNIFKNTNGNGDIILFRNSSFLRKCFPFQSILSFYIFYIYWFTATIAIQIS